MMKCAACKKIIPTQQINFDSSPRNNHHSFKCPNCGASIKIKPFSWLKAISFFVAITCLIPFIIQALFYVWFLLGFKD